MRTSAQPLFAGTKPTLSLTRQGNPHNVQRARNTSDDLDLKISTNRNNLPSILHAVEFVQNELPLRDPEARFPEKQYTAENRVLGDGPSGSIRQIGMLGHWLSGCRSITGE